MRSARVWGTLACRPCRQSLIIKLKDDRICRYASSIPQTTSRSQISNDVVDVQAHRPPRSRPLIRREANTQIRPTRRLSKINDDEAIVSDSLAQTLQAHRVLNAAGPVIRRVNRAPNWPTERRNQTKKERGASLDLELTRSPEKGRDERDYEGKARQLSMDWEIIGEIPLVLRLPWMTALDHAGPSSELAQDRLSAEIQIAGSFLTPSKREAEVASKTHKEIELHLQKTFPDLNLDIIGSRASGLAMPLSDLDLNVKHPNPKILLNIFKSMKYGGREDQIVETSYAAFAARIPIIVGVHIKTGLEIQIQQTEGAYGSLETVKGLQAEHPNIRPLFKVLKHMTKLYGLSYGLGRITSYPLLNMIAIVLKRNPQENSPRHLGLNLLKFLDFWTEGIDLYNTGITHLPSPYVPGKYGPFDTAEGYFADEEIALDTISRIVHDPVGAKPAFFNVKRDLHEIHKGRDDYRMVLYDPANPYNDLGSTVHQIKHLQATFIHIRQKLKHDMTRWDQIILSEGHMKTPSLSLLRSLLEGDYTLYNLDRKRLIHTT